MRAPLLAAVLLGPGIGCNAILDFDDLEGLPCPCDDQHVCLLESDRCVPRGRTEPFKFCQVDTPQGGDELCPAGHRCVALNDAPPRCLPSCEPVLYARPQAGRLVEEQCPFGTTCWTTEKGGVCSEGVCEDNPNTCPPGERCARFNGAGVCFTECFVYDDSPLPCGADEICHPIGLANLTACVPSGVLAAGALCTRPEDGMCEKIDGPTMRPLMCVRAEASANPELFCRPPCNPSDNTGCLPGETCALVRANVYPSIGLGLGACL